MHVYDPAFWWALLETGIRRRWLYRIWTSQGPQVAEFVAHPNWWKHPAIRKMTAKSPSKANPDAFKKTHANITNTLPPSSEKNAYITIANPNYPLSLLQIADPPLVLHIAGHAEAWNTFWNSIRFSIVGSRSLPDKEADSLLSTLLVPNQNIWICSGLARGSDTAAHRWSIAHAQSVAIIGGGIQMLTGWQQHIAEHIMKKGFIISEYPPNHRALDWHFPERNRIIAGAAPTLGILAAKEKSGSLITARIAMELGRDIYVVPWNPQSPFSTGNNSLIADGAYPWYHSRQWFPNSTQPKKTIEQNISELTEPEKNVIQRLLEQPRTTDEILENGHHLLPVLGNLESQGYICLFDDGYWHTIHQ